MENQSLMKPDYLFEVSWEVCNKIGGIHTVLASKARTMIEEYKDNYIVIGPDLRQETWNNGEFIEHPSLFKSWQTQAKKEGLKFRIGRWDIPGNPITILVDFTTYFALRDQIFAHFWETYKLDSLSGQWDYVEPVMFGYAAGKIIENFYLFNLYSRDKVAVHFHQWMSGSGILYLKEKLSEIATIFTVHGTIVANAFADSGNELYTKMNMLDVPAIAKDFGIVSKHSLEFNAAQHADILTCVGDNTVQECEFILKRQPDFITYNGYDYTLNNVDTSLNMKNSAKGVLINLAESLLNTSFDKDITIIAHSGRYQIRNKGIDMFIEILNNLNKSDNLQKPMLAFIIVPAHHTGPRYELISRLTNKDFSSPIFQEYLTHVLSNESGDSILNLLKSSSLQNKPENKVKIIYIPCYLDGYDGILNKSYYEVIQGFDLTVCPSYYDPWGYTPSESLSYGIPTITTSLTGFGSWIKNNFESYSKSLLIAERSDSSFRETINTITDFIINFTYLSENEKLSLNDEAVNLSLSWQWEKLINNYLKAYNAALLKTEIRLPDIMKNKPIVEPLTLAKTIEKAPEWRKVLVKTYIPKKLFNLLKISKNLWWSWNFEAQNLFESIDKVLWEKTEHNPIALLNSMSYEEFLELEKNEDFVNHLNEVNNLFELYLNKELEDTRLIAYFSMEFGIHDSLKIFSGGLGVLAGDYLKEASDARKNIVGIGLLYRYGYFSQKITARGEQISERIPQKFSDLPIQAVRDDNNEWIKINIPLPGRTLYAKVWKAEVGRVNLYLLDTDIDENSPNDRSITYQLYGGNNENRLIQEIVLGVGGVKALDAMGMKPMLFHCNEGHAAFSSLERLREFVQKEKFTFDEALEIVRATTLFTTHTPVPAGHDFFSEELLRTYVPHYAERLNISWESFMNLGRMQENDTGEKFSMSVLAVKTSQEVNGVSRIHGRVSREMFNKMWKDFFPNELYIDYVTNGVHYPTWTSPLWKKLHKETFGEDFVNNQNDFAVWQKIHTVSDDAIWSIRQTQRKILIDYIKIKLMQNMTARQENPKLIFEIIDAINDNALTIGFARRFATYKRAHLLFSNMEKLSKLVNNPERPMMLIFAGKAHPADTQGQELIKHIIEISKMKAFLGKVVFIENYDIALASKLIQGVDIWLNTPTRPQEASGTSGEKAVMNGVINLSVLDGWWAEGYKPKAGWALKEENTYQNYAMQDELDAETIYNMLEDEIIPLFYDRNQQDVPINWITYIKNTISEVAPHFTMNRQVNDYYSKLYNKLFKRSEILKENDYKTLKDLSAWKMRVLRAWNSIEVVDMKIPDSTIKPMRLGEKFIAEITLDLAEVSADNIGIEVLFGQKEMDRVNNIFFKQDLILKQINGNRVTFTCEIFVTRSGVFDYAFRMYVKNPLLPHRQDFNLIKWL